MDIAGRSEETRFAKIVKKIWNGPYQDLEAEEVPPMNQEKMNEANYSRAGFSKRGDPYGARAEEPELAPVDYGAAPGRYDRGPEEQDHAALRKDVTVISQGTTIVGDIKSDSGIEMLGTMTGSIATSGNVKINGKQNGDVQGAGIELSACTVRGNLNAAEDINIDSDSVIVGDIKCGNLTIDGKLKGNVHVMGNVSCEGNSVLIGDITSTTITVSSGAKLKGKIEISDGNMEPVEIEDGAGRPEENPFPTADGAKQT